MIPCRRDSRDGATAGRADDPLSISRVRLSIGAIDVLNGRHLRHHFAPHMHEFFGIGVIDGGVSEVRYRGATSTAASGTLIAISAGEIHTGAPVGDDGWS